ncbi:Uncharacterized protein GBIM_09622, partial [Gryllus bimaculatus]
YNFIWQTIRTSFMTGSAMATKQMSKTAWQTSSTTRPVNEVQSSLFVKKLVAMSISHIVYLRGLLPEEAFMDREMDGVPVKIIYEKSQFAPAVQIVKWLKGAFEAFDKKYLERMEFIFFVDESPEPMILECYSFTFTYGDEHVLISCDSTKESQAAKKFKLDEIRSATVQLLRLTTMLMQNMRKATENLSMKVRLYYYDEVTPEDYEPPGFQRAPVAEYVFEPNSSKLRHGTVDTGFHRVKLSSRIGPSRFQEKNEISNDAQETLQRKISDKTSPAETMECHSSPQSSPKDLCSDTTAVASEKSGQMEVEMENRLSPSQGGSGGFNKDTPTDVQNASVHCACGISEDEGLLIFCEICRRWNHAMICLYRRALAFCLSTWRVDQKILSSELSIPPEIADDLLMRMELDQVFSNKRKRGKGLYHRINSSHLRDVVIPEYFDKATVKLPSALKQSLHSEDVTKTEEESPIKNKLRKIIHETCTVMLEPRK